MLKKNTRTVKLRNDIELSLLTIPGLLCLLIFNYLPMFGVIIAFKDYKPMLGILGSEWVGFENFRFFFTSADALRVIGNTMSYAIVFLVLDVLLGVALAIAFYFLRTRVGLKLYNTVMIMPNFMSMVVIAFVVYALLNPAQGLLNGLLNLFGADPIQWYSEPKYWPFILSIVHVWKGVGMGCVIYYAALMGMDESLLEAAEIDGANLFYKIKDILIPHLKQLMIISTILALGRIFSGDFGLFYQVPQNVGALYPTTDIINTYTYRALMDGDMAKSAAVGLFQSIAGFIMVVGTNLIVRKISPEDSLF